MPSTVPAAKVGLLAALSAMTWPGQQPEVRYGQPTEGEDVAFLGETVFLGETTGTAGFRGAGMPREENYTLRFVIDVRQEGDDEATVEARAWALEAAAETVLLQNMTLGGAINRISGIEARQVNQPGAGWWRTQIVVDLTAHQYLVA